MYVETVPGPRSPEISAEPAIDIQVKPENPEEMAVREGNIQECNKHLY